MTLKMKFLLLASTTMVAVLIVSEWLTYREVAAFLDSHRQVMESVEDGRTALAALEEGTQALLMRFVWLHFAIAALSLGVLAVVLHLGWRRVVRKRLEALAGRIAKMERGTWDIGEADDGEDEIAALERRITHLGKTVTATAEQFGDVSKLAALALLGHSIARDVTSVSLRIKTVISELNKIPDGPRGSVSQAVAELQTALRCLEGIPLRLQQQFEREFQKHAASDDRVLP